MGRRRRRTLPQHTGDGGHDVRQHRFAAQGAGQSVQGALRSDGVAATKGQIIQKSHSALVVTLGDRPGYKP